MDSEIDSDMDLDSYDDMPGLVPDSNYISMIPCTICGNMILEHDFQSHVSAHFQSLFAIPMRPLLSAHHTINNWSPFAFEHNTPTSILYAGTILYNDTIDDYEQNLRLAELIGNVSVGITDVETVGTIIPNRNICTESNQMCTICMDPIHQTGNDARELICGHVYCQPCIDKWLTNHKKCPVCNVDLEDLKNEQKANA